VPNGNLSHPKLVAMLIELGSDAAAQASIDENVELSSDKVRLSYLGTFAITVV
jgi:hypothetical protein